MTVATYRPMSTATDLKRAAAAVEAALARRDALILKMREEGHTLRDIAAVANLSHVGVAKIIARAG